jgi:curved DNA-binding protein CbpA
MTDYFAVLGLERRPAIDENTLKAAYFRKSEELHPDRAAENDFSVVNAAFQTLSNPAQRIQHLIRLEFGDSAAGKIGPQLGTLFGRVALLARKADQETGAVAAQDSSLLRALALQRFGPLRDDLAALADELSKNRFKLIDRIQTLDQEWTSNAMACRDPLAQAAIELTFIQKWAVEVGERMLKLEELV